MHAAVAAASARAALAETTVTRSQSPRLSEWPILLDEEQIKQLFINLIKNSLEAGDDTMIWLTISDTADSVVITVEDDGPGFSEDQLQAGFQPYLSTKKDGSGLGLVICQRIVVDHGGSIELYNRSEGGAGVKVLLPQDNG